MRWTATLAALALLVGCKPDDSGLHILTQVDEFWQEPTNQIDILWVVDDSASMAEEQAALADGFGDFIESIEQTNTDFQLGVITTSFDTDDPDAGKLLGTPVNPDDPERPADPAVITSEDDYIALFEQRVQVGTGGSDKEKGLAAATYALSPVMTQGGANDGFMRDEAFLLVIFITDEDDCSDDGAMDSMSSAGCYSNRDLLVPVSNIVVEFQQLKSPDRLVTGGIIGPKAADNEGCVSGVVSGVRYRQFLEYTGGSEGNICDSDFGSIMFDMGLNAAGTRTAFLLSESPRIDTIEVWVDDTEIMPSSTSGWSFNEETNYLLFNGDSVPERGSKVTVEYQLQSG